MKLKTNEEAYAQARAKGKSRVESALDAGYDGKAPAQWGQMQDGKAQVMARIMELNGGKRPPIGKSGKGKVVLRRTDEGLVINTPFVIKQLLAILDRCMESVPVVVNKVITGTYKFDAGGALHALELIGKEYGMFEGASRAAASDPHGFGSMSVDEVLAYLTEVARDIQRLRPALTLESGTSKLPLHIAQELARVDQIPKERIAPTKVDIPGAADVPQGRGHKPKPAAVPIVPRVGAGNGKAHAGQATNGNGNDSHLHLDGRSGNGASGHVGPASMAVDSGGSEGDE